jgi:uncharacterized protein YqjF (DUF2071 family)
MTMSWHDLLFMHWPLPPRVVSALLPRGLEVDTFDGAAWVGVVPFRMTNVGMRGTPEMPGISSFAELNVRTYAKHGDKAGVWFLSLDAASRLAVAGARALFHLPYFHASIDFSAREDGWIGYRSNRSDRRSGPARFDGRYRPVGDPKTANAGTLEHWLTERYCLFAADRRGRLSRTDVHHAPWPLQPAEANVDTNTMPTPANITLPASPPLLHFARRLDVLAWMPQSL